VIFWPGRRPDLRSQHRVQQWEDPFQAVSRH
jgi:hypothetical protein